MTLVVFGGTFDPPHYAHLLLAECARAELGGSRVVFLPAGDPYHKHAAAPADHEPTAAEHRLAMLRLAVADNDRFVVDDRELRREGPSYTVDTLSEIAAEGNPDLTLVIGSDSLGDFPFWKEPQRILALARIAIATKPSELGDGGAPAFRARRTPDSPGAPADLVSRLTKQSFQLRTMPQVAISSTIIRARVRDRLPIRYLVPDAVESYIREHRLYRDEAR
jgi:nicotinate-nucleotide adenylyltransferase